MTDPIRVFLLDDHELTRTGFRFILGREKDIEVVGGAPARDNVQYIP